MDIRSHGKIVSKIGLVSKLEFPIRTNTLFFRSSLPNGTYDIHNQIKDIWKKIHFTKVICLIDDDEYKRKTHTNKDDTYYFLIGTSHVCIPINTHIFENDLWMDSIYQIIQTTIMTSLNSEKPDKICIHCSGGIGRTGLMYVCILMHIGYNYDNSVKLVYKNIPDCLNKSKLKALKKYYQFLRVKNI